MSRELHYVYTVCVLYVVVATPMVMSCTKCHPRDAKRYLSNRAGSRVSCLYLASTVRCDFAMHQAPRTVPSSHYPAEVTIASLSYRHRSPTRPAFELHLPQSGPAGLMGNGLAVLNTHWWLQLEAMPVTSVSKCRDAYRCTGGSSCKWILRNNSIILVA